MKQIIVGLIVIVLSGGCAMTHTSIQSQALPQTSKYQVILVWGAFNSLKDKDLVENTVSEGLSNMGCLNWTAGKIFLWGEEYRPAEIEAGLTEHNVDAILYISSSGVGLSNVYVPKSSVSKGESDAYVTSWGVHVNSQTRTQYYGGYNISKPWEVLQAKLVDTRTGKAVWVAETRSRGNAFADFDDLKRSMSSKIAQELKKDGLLK